MIVTLRLAIERSRKQTRAATRMLLSEMKVSARIHILHLAGGEDSTSYQELFSHSLESKH